MTDVARSPGTSATKAQVVSHTSHARGGQYLSFRVAGSLYAVDILRAREIIPRGDITSLPRAPAFIAGVINLRGAVVPVVDLALRLGVARDDEAGLGCIVVAELVLDGDAARIGWIVDNVEQVIDLTDEQVDPPPTMGVPVEITYLRGVARTPAGLLLVLDADALVGEEALRAAWVDAEREPASESAADA
jgi:purine-binding chemotaxis protein CheW